MAEVVVEITTGMIAGVLKLVAITFALFFAFLLGAAKYLRKKLGKAVFLLLFAIVLGSILIYLVTSWGALVPQMTNDWLGRVGIGISVTITIGMALFFLRFTTVKEGTAKTVVKGAGFHKVIMTWKDHTIDKNNDTISTPGKKRLLGGIHFVGVYPLYRILEYRKRWQVLNLTKEKEEPQIVFHDEVLDFFPLQPTGYLTVAKDAETMPPERLRLTLWVVINYEVTNIYKALFVASLSYHERFMELVNASLVSFVSKRKSDGILASQRTPKRLWQTLHNDPAIQMAEKDWGLRILENGTRIASIRWPSDYQAALAREAQMEFEAKGKAAETVGTVIAMIAKSRGKKEEEIQDEINKDPEIKKEFLGLAKDLIIRRMGIEGGAYVDIRVQGATGIEQVILEALAAWQRMPHGSSKKEKRRNKKRTKKIQAFGVETTVPETEEEEEEEG